MPTYYCKVVLPYTTGIPRDRAEFALVLSAAAPPDPEDFTEVIETFFNINPPGGPTSSISEFLSPIISGENCYVDIYELNLAAGEIGEPLAQVPITVDISESLGGLPDEVALCSSYQSNAAGVAIRRRRGRIYLGPFNTFGLGGDVAGSRPSASMVDVVRRSTFRLQAELQALGLSWCVWSRSNAAVYPITSGWVDNAWDTQRRRGLDESVRSTWVTV